MLASKHRTAELPLLHSSVLVFPVLAFPCRIQDTVRPVYFWYGIFCTIKTQGDTDRKRKQQK